MKSLLSSFKNDFNRIVSVYPKVESQNNSGELETTWPSVGDADISCLLLLNNQQYDKYIGGDVEYTKSTHKIRLDTGPTINKGDKILDNKGVWYTVKFVTSTPGFGGYDDHILVLADIIL